MDLADVDPIYFDHPYFLVPAGESEGTLRAYRLLVETMGRGERAALGRFVMRTKEYLAALWVRDGALTITTMRFHDEVRPGADPGRRQEADEEGARQRDRGDRGAVHRLGPRALHRLLSRAPAA